MVWDKRDKDAPLNEFNKRVIGWNSKRIDIPLPEDIKGYRDILRELFVLHTKLSEIIDEESTDFKYKSFAASQLMMETKDHMLSLKDKWESRLREREVRKTRTHGEVVNLERKGEKMAWKD